MIVEEVAADRIRMRMRTVEAELRPGATVSGPTTFTLVDTVAWLLTLAQLAPGLDAVTSDVTMQFLRRPPLGDLVAEGRLLRMGRRASVVDVDVRTDDGTVVAHATVTYAPLLGAAQ